MERRDRVKQGLPGDLGVITVSQLVKVSFILRAEAEWYGVYTGFVSWWMI
jgi:hypothetical protein